MKSQKFLSALFAFVVLVIILPIPIHLVSAVSGQTTLLAVAETDNGTEGRTATLSLEIKDGKGEVYLATYPFSKVDTQVSTRFARDIACQYLNKDCSKLDFFYTIKATGGIIAGPSAGAATTALTIALLEGKQLDDKIALTGSINSGATIGQVGGVKEKLDAAAKAGMKKVLIPIGEGIIEEDNKSIDLYNLSKEKGVLLVEVSDIDDVLYEFGVMKEKPQEAELKIAPFYNDVMKFLAEDLCNRSEKLDTIINSNENVEKYHKNKEFIRADFNADNLMNKSASALAKKNFYSAASYCFGANVHKSFEYYLVLEMSNYTNEIGKLNGLIDEMEQEMSKSGKKTITDLEAYMAVEERLAESREYLKNFEKEKDLNLLAFAKERIYSAYSWRTFLNHEGKKFRIDETSLKKSCENMLGEVQEKYQYLDTLFPSFLGDISDEIDTASGYYHNGHFEMCLFKASLAKAKSNVLLSSLYIGKSAVPTLIDQKLAAAKKVIVKETAKGIFPVLGYSYYEYAQNLRGDQYSSLLYSEYAIELSNLDIYFKTDSGKLDAVLSGAKDFVSSVAFRNMLISMGAVLLAIVLVVTILRSSKHAGEKGSKKKEEVKPAKKVKVAVKKEKPVQVGSLSKTSIKFKRR